VRIRSTITTRFCRNADCIGFFNLKVQNYCCLLNF
jgi:hypothetical protein